MALEKIDLRSLELNPYDRFQEQKALVGAGTMDKFNMMTIAWGGIGVIWRKPACTTYVRESRYTKEFMDENELFTVTFLKDGYQDVITRCGVKSGREIDKMHDSGLTPIPLEGSVGFEEADLILVCRKMYCAEMPKENFVYAQTLNEFYPEGDYHTMYVGEIIAAYQAK